MADPVSPAAPAPAATAPSSPAEAAAEITAAKAIGGIAYRQVAERLDAAGVLPYAERQLLASLRRTVPNSSVDTAMLHGGHSAADARTQVQGDALMRAGRTLEETRETIGDPTFEPDTRSEAQRRYDAENGIAPVIDQRAYTVSTPPGETPASWAPVDADARSFAADLGLAPQAGSDFIRAVVAAGTELAGGNAGRWEQTLAVVFPGDKLAEAVARVDAMLKERAGTSRMAANLRKQGLLRNPELLVRLNNRALTLAHRAATRPA